MLLHTDIIMCTCVYSPIFSLSHIQTPQPMHQYNVVLACLIRTWKPSTVSARYTCNSPSLLGYTQLWTEAVLQHCGRLSQAAAVLQGCFGSELGFRLCNTTAVSNIQRFGVQIGQYGKLFKAQNNWYVSSKLVGLLLFWSKWSSCLQYNFFPVDSTV